MITLKQWFVIFLLSTIASFSFAAIPEWEILPEKSKITFTGVQNDSPVTGSFKKFSGVIQFDLNQLTNNKVQIIIDMNSVSTSFSDLTTTLITPDWFDVSIFPNATFEAHHFKKLNDTQYEADGSLTIRNRTVPVVLKFSATELPNNEAKVEGATTLKRTAFGVGQGEWADTSSVKDDVQVNFLITAKKK
jgi:polyisoprenoid-binding protein YceI